MDDSISRRGTSTEPGARRHLASGWLINGLDPDRFVLTGSIGECDEAMKARLHAAIAEQADPGVLQHCSIRVSTMGRQAWIRGGVSSALERQQALEADGSWREH